MKKRYIVLIIIALVIVGVFIAGKIAFDGIASNLKNLATMEIQDIDLNAIKDGVYQGSYSAFPVEAEVRVTVKNHAITAIELVKHQNGQGQTAEAIPDKVVASQSLQVDVVSGATYSSKVILKAIEAALLGALK
jgi:uncharacterized protein with FMN-binding domain